MMNVVHRGTYLLAKEHGMKVYIPLARIGLKQQPCNKPFGRARDAQGYGSAVSERYTRLKQAAKEIL